MPIVLRGTHQDAPAGAEIDILSGYRFNISACDRKNVFRTGYRDTVRRSNTDRRCSAVVCPLSNAFRQLFLQAGISLVRIMR